MKGFLRNLQIIWARTLKEFRQRRPSLLQPALDAASDHVPATSVFHVHALHHSHQDMRSLLSVVLPTPRCVIYDSRCDIPAPRDRTKTYSKLSTAWNKGFGFVVCKFGKRKFRFRIASLLARCAFYWRRCQLLKLKNIRDKRMNDISIKTCTSTNLSTTDLLTRTGMGSNP